MINQGNNVPDKTIAVFTNSEYSEDFQKQRIFNLISKSPKKREWFTPHFYRCLPLIIGNTYGFTIHSEFAFSMVWNGGPNLEDIALKFEKNPELLKDNFPNISTHFGSGIVTIIPPFTLRTPPGVNLMTINPPNFVIPNVTVMTGVVETDNLRRNFTFNLKLQMPNIATHIPAGVPLAAFIPIPRYYADSFQLKMADEIFSQELVKEEQTAENDSAVKRNTVEILTKNKVGRDYFKGIDTYGNVFPNHQTP
jgi:hypothetical protein